MDETPKRVWVRLVGAAALLAIVAGSVAIVGRAAPGSRPVPVPTTGDQGRQDGQSQTGSLGDVAELHACVATDAEFADTGRATRLRRLLGLSEAGAGRADAYADLIDIASAVEQLRGFRFTQPVTTRFVSSEKIPQLVGKPLPARQAALADLILSALGVLQRSEHVSRLSRDLITDQVAGFYQPKANKLVVPSPGPGQSLAPLDKAVLAHELEHALVDQRLDLTHGLPNRLTDLDGSLAALAVIEGSATVTGYRWTASGLSLLDQLRLSSDPRVAGGEGLPTAVPHYLVQQFSWPYLAGVQFVCELYDRGGWRLVNRALRNPPKTTLEIMSPKLYLDGYKAPRAPEPHSPGLAWRHVHQTTFGAANWTWLLEAPGSNPDFGLEDAEQLARLWAGGELHVWTSGPKVAVAVVGKTSGHELCTSMLQWYDVSFEDNVRFRAPGLRGAWQGETQHAAAACPDDEIRLGIAPSNAAAARIVLSD